MLHGESRVRGTRQPLDGEEERKRVGSKEAPRCSLPEDPNQYDSLEILLQHLSNPQILLVVPGLFLINSYTDNAAHNFNNGTGNG